MKTRDILITVTRILPGWHVYNDHQFGRITAFDPQAGYEVTVNLPDSDTISIVRTRYELVEDNTVLDTADMGEEQALDELARLLASPMPRTDRLMRLKDKFEKTAEWCRNTLGDEQEAKDVEDMAEHYMHVCESCNNKYSGRQDDLRVRDTREWRFLTDEEFRRLGHAKPSDVSYAGDLDDYGMFDGTWRAAVDCGDALPHASEYSISGMLIAFDDKTVWETVCAGLDLLGKE